MATTLKKLIQSAPKMRGSLPKKAQTGIKATKDSTDYYKDKVNQVAKQIKKETPNLPRFKSNDLNDNVRSQKMINSVSERAKAISNQLRQSKKGKPGYDANGFPKKKNGGSIKAKNGIKCWTGYKKQGTKTKSGKTVNNCVKK